jgi:hypothetical protein
MADWRSYPSLLDRTMSVVVSPASHHGWRSGASFKISDKERRFISQLAEERKRKASCSAPRYLCHRENQSKCSEPALGIMHGVLGALTFSPSKPCNTPLTASGDRAHTSTMSTHLAWQSIEEDELSHPRLQKECVGFVLQRSNPNKPTTWYNSMRGT